MATRAVREGVSTDSLKFYAGPPCPTLTRPAGGPPPKRPYPLDTPSRTGLMATPFHTLLLKILSHLKEAMKTSTVLKETRGDTKVVDF
jgi:hypothetical protein